MPKLWGHAEEMPLKATILGSRAVSGHIEYLIRIDAEGQQWCVSRRYTDFERLHAEVEEPLRSAVGPLPPKGALGIRHKLNIGGFNEKREAALQAYLSGLSERVQHPGDLPAWRTFVTNADDADASAGSPFHASDMWLGESQTWRGAMNAFSGANTEMIRSPGQHELEIDAADMIRLLAMEAFMGHLPVAKSGFFGVAFKLDVAEPSAAVGIFRDGLQEVFRSRPALAGRVCGRFISLCNHGVPFTWRACTGSMPARIPHNSVADFCDVRSPAQVMAGREPLLTVQIQSYADGLIVGLAASHAVFDGSSLFSFLQSWARACRGEPLPPATDSREAFQVVLRRSARRRDSPDIVPTVLNRMENTMDRIHDRLGDGFRQAEDAYFKTASIASLWAASHLVPAFLSLSQGNMRLRIPVAKDRVEQIKTMATPPPGAEGDGWVSTQEALVAHLLLTLWQTGIGRSGNSGRACLSLLVDVRRFLEIDAGIPCGTGFQMVSTYIDGMDNLDLVSCATAVHNACKGVGPEAAARWSLWHRGFECRVESEAFIRDLRTSQRSSDLSLAINNNSKREACDFGPSAGGLVSEYASTMGPTLIMATRDGLDILLQQDLVADASDATLQEFLQRFDRDL